METIILPGNSKRSNEMWIEDLKKGLMPYFEEVIAVHYDHWNSEEEMDFESEKAKVERSLNEIKGDYAMIAKSIGSVITMALIKEGKANPKYCIFAGLPIEGRGDTELERNLKGYNIPTVFIQNPDERFIKPDQLQKLLAKLKVKNFELVSGRGEEHAYTVEEMVEVAQNMNHKYAN